MEATATAPIAGPSPRDHGIPFGEPVPDLREIDWGQAEGVDVDEAEQRATRREAGLPVGGDPGVVPEHRG